MLVQVVMNILYELKILLKMMQVCLLRRMKMCWFLHASGMFPQKTLSALCGILQTPGISLTKDIDRFV